MKRVLAALAIVVLVASVLTGVLISRLVQHPPSKHPEISAYSDGQLVRVGPYRYCDVLNPTNCETPKSDGQLTVDPRHPVQLSVPPEIARAPWVLVRSYEGADVVDEFRPDTKLAVTIPTVASGVNIPSPSGTTWESRWNCVSVDLVLFVQKPTMFQ